MFLAEIGDKTFILTMISMKELGVCITFFTSCITLCSMHLLASVFGWGVSFVVPAFWTKLVASILFCVIGILMFVYACYERDPHTVDAHLGKQGQAYTLSHREPAPVEEKVDQKEGGDKDKDSSSSGSGDSSGSDEEDGHSNGSGSHSSDSHKSGTDSSSDQSDGNGSCHDGRDHDTVHNAPNHIRKQTTMSYAPNLDSLKTVKHSKADEHGHHDHHKERYMSLKIEGKKLQRFCCCGMSQYVLLPMMLVAGEMCDKTQIVAVSMAPNYGFQSIAIGGVFAQFFSVGLACLCSKIFIECFTNRFWLDIFAGFMFMIFGLYEIIGELVMENSNTWAERKV